MNKVLILFLSVIVVGISACTDPDKIRYGDWYTGSVSADLNGVVDGWKARSVIATSGLTDADRYVILFNINSDLGEYRETMLIAPVLAEPQEIIPFNYSEDNNIEEQINQENVTYATMQSDGDVVCSYYLLDTTFNNVFHIDEFNENTHRAKGRFNLRYLKVEEDRFCPLSVLDTVELTNGVFDVNGLSEHR